jgi:hypothetical protein
VEPEQLTLPENQGSPPVYSGARTVTLPENQGSPPVDGILINYVSVGVPIFTERERMLLTHIPDYGWRIMISE